MTTTLSTSKEAAATRQDSRAVKYLVFQLAGEEFGIQVQKVREIMGVQDITQVPQTPPYVKGVINLRGKVIPVVDLRLKFTMPSVEYTQRTCIIVVEAAGERGPMLMGVVVDAVAEVLSVSPGEVEEAPSFGHDVDTSYILGLGKVKGQVKILLDIDRVMTARELKHLELAAG